MKDKTRRYETGKMLIDLAKYFATVTSAASLANSQVNWKAIFSGLVMATCSWAVGFLIIPNDKEDK